MQNLWQHSVIATQHLSHYLEFSSPKTGVKISKLLNHSKHKENILSLAVGSFLYVVKDEIISFPKFEPEGKPFLWQYKEDQQNTIAMPYKHKIVPPTRPRRKLGFLQRLKQVLTQSYHSYEQEDKDALEKDEDELTEEIDTVYGTEDDFEPM